MFEIGPSLREARDKRGLSAEDVQKAIRIRGRYLNALEEERWELLPGDAYIKGFLRTYAEFLGLNGNLYVDEFNSRYARREDGPLVHEALAPIGAPRIGFLRPLIAILAIVAIVGAVAAWQLHRSSTPKTHHTAGVTRTAVRHVTKPKAAPLAKPSAVKAAAIPAVTTPAAAALPAKGVLAAVRGPVWLQVRQGSASGPILYDGFLPQGHTIPVKVDKTPVWFRVGAPWNLDVRLGGKLQHGLPTDVGNVLLTQQGLSAG
ncbi:MAG: helix-turn-helix domain-containing protein [Actinobacteria bacterium]|nr:helix-turn-helix domain-containing protein [Actinomycetota bacterium]